MPVCPIACMATTLRGRASKTAGSNWIHVTDSARESLANATHKSVAKARQRPICFEDIPEYTGVRVSIARSVTAGRSSTLLSELVILRDPALECRGKAVSSKQGEVALPRKTEKIERSVHAQTKLTRQCASNAARLGHTIQLLKPSQSSFLSGCQFIFFEIHERNIIRTIAPRSM